MIKIKTASMILLALYSLHSQACTQFAGKYSMVSGLGEVDTIEIIQTGCERIESKFLEQNASEVNQLDGKPWQFREFILRTSKWDAEENKVLIEDLYQFSNPYTVNRILELMPNGDVAETSTSLEHPSWDIKVVFKKSY